MPFTATPREGLINAKGLLPPAFAPALSLTPPTLVPASGDGVLDGHCKVTVRSPADRDRLESADAFVTRWNFRAWD